MPFFTIVSDLPNILPASYRAAFGIIPALMKL